MRCFRLNTSIAWSQCRDRRSRVSAGIIDDDATSRDLVLQAKKKHTHTKIKHTYIHETLERRRRRNE